MSKEWILLWELKVRKPLQLWRGRSPSVAHTIHLHAQLSPTMLEARLGVYFFPLWYSPTTHLLLPSYCFWELKWTERRCKTAEGSNNGNWKGLVGERTPSLDEPPVLTKVRSLRQMGTQTVVGLQSTQMNMSSGELVKQISLTESSWAPAKRWGIKTCVQYRVLIKLFCSHSLQCLFYTKENRAEHGDITQRCQDKSVNVTLAGRWKEKQEKSLKL